MHGTHPPCRHGSTSTLAPAVKPLRQTGQSSLCVDAAAAAYVTTEQLSCSRVSNSGASRQFDCRCAQPCLSTIIRCCSTSSSSSVLRRVGVGELGVRVALPLPRRRLRVDGVVDGVGSVSRDRSCTELWLVTCKSQRRRPQRQHINACDRTPLKAALVVGTKHPATHGSVGLHPVTEVCACV
jgi:hypothetical protein